jgi:hypothetical protein
MTLRLATVDERSGVVAAGAAFRAHWASFRNLGECGFTGGVEDIGALDSLRYEGLGYPESGFGGASLMWGNVLATSGPFWWYTDEATGSLVLSPGREDPSFPIVWPYGRVGESELYGPVTFRWLTAQVVAECLARSGLDRKDEARLLSLVDESTRREYAQRFEVALERMG